MAHQPLHTPMSQVLEEVAFQKAAVDRLKAEILGVDPNSRKRYIREFHEEYGRYEAISSLDDLTIACYKADIIFIGDYHALPQSQAFAERLLRDIASRSREAVLCLEMVYGCHQRVLDGFMSGDVGEAEFLKGIRYDLDWGYDWNSFHRLFLAAREHGVDVFGIDCGPRAGCRYIRRRDTYAAERIVDIVTRRPGARLVVLIGESHLATNHLPAKVTDRLKKRCIEKRRVIVLQNQEEVYWRLAEKGLEHVDVVTMKNHRPMDGAVFCHFNSSPIAKYEAYRQRIEVWKGDVDDDAIDLTSTVHSMIDTILRFLGVDKYTHCVTRERVCREFLVDVFPEIYSQTQLDDLERLLRTSHRFSPEEIDDVRSHVARNGSCYVPRVNAVFIGEFDMVHAGEEAAHFVNLVLKGEIRERAPRAMPQPDVFYGGVMEEALGFFGSKLIDPSRNHFFETEFYEYYKKDRDTIESKTPYRFDEFNEIIAFILLHKDFESSYENYTEVPRLILDGIRSDPRRANILIHELGYFLGQQIYDAYRAGRLMRKGIAQLFRASYRESGSALGAYLDLCRMVHPDRGKDGSLEP